ncbi:MAG: methyltransferase domain-containing protein [Paracoccaceae bacterium]|nr:methyltransferase domain-containing protein [Paracoccaceae bacterium]
MLQFGEETAKRLEIAYRGADFERRRRASFDALGPKPGEVLADIGCGNGMLSETLAMAVGPEGRVIGIDPSAEMLRMAAPRADGLEALSFTEGAAEALPLEDGAADGAVSLQVFEYVAGIPAALAEARRVLRPGGRLVLGDMCFSSLVWASDDPDRMARMTAAWDGHVVHTDLPAALPGLLGDAGFAVETVAPLTFLDTDLRPDGIAAMMLMLIEPYAVRNGHVGEDEARAWAEEQRALAAAGRFFFALTHVVIRARRV